MYVLIVGPPSPRCFCFIEPACVGAQFIATVIAVDWRQRGRKASSFGSLRTRARSGVGLIAGSLLSMTAGIRQEMANRGLPHRLLSADALASTISVTHGPLFQGQRTHDRKSMMPLHHAVVLISHHSAQVIQINAEQAVNRKLTEHTHYTRQHGGKVRSEHEFFAEVCSAMKGLGSVLVAGSHMAQADFRHYVEKHSTASSAQIVGWMTVDHPTEREIVKLARGFFVGRGELVATSRMT